MYYSLIIPVFNRPDHIEALLQCLAKQKFKNFEVLVIESGSTIRSDKVAEGFMGILDVKYFFKGNDGQGFSRNYGMERANGEYFVILDSDILLDDDYLSNLDTYLRTTPLDCFGGPDRLHPASNDIQKAVNYCMTSFLTTGGTRGKSTSVGVYYPRSFNMGFSRKVYEATKGYKIPFLGEDIELSRRIQTLGFRTGLVESAYVYHERKKSFSGFYKQMHWFGRARVNIYTFFPDTLKLVHLIPVAFTLYTLLAIILLPFSPQFSIVLFVPWIAYLLAIITDASFTHKSLK
ncbi:MAG: glycosyltransferase, partial [Cytophagales bacterium]|nr:glycosyltransferase [Cytophagales bacterium]